MTRDVGAIIVNTLMGFALEAARKFTKHEISGLSANPIQEGLHLITPIEPSERSGGGKAVKELAALFSKRLPVRTISLPSAAIYLSDKLRKAGEILMSGIPAQKTSLQIIFGGEKIEKLLIPRLSIFLEFSEGATFLLFRRRLNRLTILRDHEILLRRFDRTGDAPVMILKRLRDASARYLCKAFLRNIYQKVDIIVTLTNEDATYIQERFPSVKANILTIPVAFAPPDQNMKIKYLGITTSDNRESRDLLFLGNFFHKPNVEALDWFLSECAPHLDQGFTLHLCGMDEPIKNMRFVGNNIEIIRHGFLEDLEGELRWVRIGVSPVISGGGTRIKNLYLGSTGRVVVTTPLGNEGIGFRDGDEAIIRSDGYSMAEELNAIAKDSERIRRIGTNAAQKIKKEFSPERIWQYYSNKVFKRHIQESGDGKH